MVDLARADTPLAAANLSLAALRQPPIADLTANNDRARALATTFAAARRAALRLRWWNFATGYETLAAAAGVTGKGKLKTIYPLPADCVAVRFVEDSEADQWELMPMKADTAGSNAEVLCLASNLTAPSLCYTRDIENVRLWDSDFLLAFSFQHAALAGPQLGASASRVQSCQAQAEGWRAEAEKIDAQEKSAGQVTRNTSWIQARRRGGSVSRR